MMRLSFLGVLFLVFATACGDDDASPIRDLGTDADSMDASRPDDGGIAPGACDTESEQCGTTCLRPISCVTECGGPSTSCGCCPCLPGSFDDIGCSDSGDS